MEHLGKLGGVMKVLEAAVKDNDCAVVLEDTTRWVGHPTEGGVRASAASPTTLSPRTSCLIP